MGGGSENPYTIPTATLRRAASRAAARATVILTQLYILHGSLELLRQLKDISYEFESLSFSNEGYYHSASRTSTELNDSLISPQINR
ncbi:hypothetical protein RB195_002612 [Necator americanus]|uniref:Uncharacterized protein n=1 Tax=Necator americanus TaxID=51031 RepID=A0ABR1DK49_NECAM